jgi:hypothetical protein
LEQTKLSNKEQKNLKGLLRGKNKVLENLDKKEAKKLYGKMKHLNTETVFSAITNIVNHPAHKAVVDKYITILPAFLRRYDNASRQNNVSQEELHQHETNFLSEISNTLGAVGYYPKSEGGKLDLQELRAFLNLYEELSPKSKALQTEKLNEYFGSGKVNDLARTTNLLNNVREFAEGEEVTGFLGNLL